jgi:hypothetical protein
LEAKTSLLNERGTTEKDGKDSQKAREVDIREFEGSKSDACQIGKTAHSLASELDEKKQASSSHDSLFEEAQGESNSSLG